MCRILILHKLSCLMSFQAVVYGCAVRAPRCRRGWPIPVVFMILNGRSFSAPQPIKKDKGCLLQTPLSVKIDMKFHGSAPVITVGIINHRKGKCKHFFENFSKSRYPTRKDSFAEPAFRLHFCDGSVCYSPFCAASFSSLLMR